MLNKKQPPLIRKVPVLLALAIGFGSLAPQSFADIKVVDKSRPASRDVIEKTIDASSGSASTFSRAFAVPMERYIISGIAPSIARYRGGIDGYDATSTEGKTKLNVKSSTAQAYRGYLENSQEELIANIEKTLGRSVTRVQTLQTAVNAVVIELTSAEAQKISILKDIKSIQKDQLHQLESNDSILDGYAQPSQDNSNWVYLTAATLLLTLALIFWAYRSGRFSKTHARLASMLAVLGLAGCYWEGGFAWINAPQVWKGVGQMKGTMGEGVIVGIIDTGINPTSDSFAARGGDGYKVANPLDSYVGVCNPSETVYDATFPCNDKLIGAWGHPTVHDGSPRDKEGHGSHTAGTSAGNIVFNATVKAPSGYTITKDIAGVAPHANIIAYNVCDENGCYTSAILFAIDRAIQDGVDVINYSIGGGADDPWVNQTSLAYLTAMDAGIFVATSAGNSGPAPETLGSPADAPWITAVASSSHNYMYKSALVDLTGGDTTPPADIIGQAMSEGYGPAVILDATDYGNPLCLEDQFTAKFDGEIVLCDAGEIARVEKGQNVAKNGGGALILTRPNTTPDGTGYWEADTHYIPAVHIMYTDAAKLREWLSTGKEHMGTISGTTPVIANEYADVLAYFSSKGSNPSLSSIIKPNITAPGRAIFAAYNEDYSDLEQDYNIIQGTSMSSPHIAGSGALMKALHPDWTPMQIQSALMTTANTMHYKEDGVTIADPFDVGAGRVDLAIAARAALVLDETASNFLEADPYINGDPATLNLASLGQGSCVVNCSWTRTVTNVSHKTTRWKATLKDGVTVTPSSFSLNPGESIELSFMVDVSDVPAGDWQFTQVGIKSLTHGIPDVHFPLAALSSLSNLPAAVEITTAVEADVTSLEGLKAVEITAADINVIGLTKSEATSAALISDPTSGNPFDGYETAEDGAFFFTVDIPNGAARFVAEITASESGDMDLFVGLGDTPSQATMIASSATGYALEYISLSEVPATTLWVLVQNWEAGHTDPSAVTVHTAVVEDMDQGNMTVTIPTSVPAGEEFAADIAFNLPGSVAGDRYYGAFSIGTDSSTPGNLGTITVDLVRE
ncbi:S8 family serine peptidase [Gynuella sunshinyii]|uniref:Subtilisin-like serine protease n=1 Tax=Gynuella sunshinyii YC6258 TaxID=1445510 RepID=A0A0C5V1N8_9GAMM|nr:S8 family serine peptidase [Gynuella sunshinyii]AJQ93465.1 subtilisin-like serine protease [Gynuella sunshinyii YC6258]